MQKIIAKYERYDQSPGRGCACKRKAAGNDAAWGGKHFARALLDADASVVEKILHRIEEAKEALARRKNPEAKKVFEEIKAAEGMFLEAVAESGFVYRDVLIGVAKNSRDEPYIVEFVVNQSTNEVTSVDVLYSVNAKTNPIKEKESVGSLSPEVTDIPATLTDSVISIAQLLDFVNRYFPDIMPEDVYRHYGHAESGFVYRDGKIVGADDEEEERQKGVQYSIKHP